MSTKAIATVILFTLPGAVLAQEDPVSPDRPGFATGPTTAGSGRVIVEAGVEYGLGGEVGTLPLALLRYGVSEATEVRVSWTGVTAGDGSADVQGGSVEVKHTLYEGRGAVPTIGLLGAFSVPSENGTPGPVDPSLGFLWSSSLTNRVGVFGTVTVGAPSSDGERRWQGTNAVGVGVSLTDRASVFAEHYVVLDEGEEDRVQYVDAGLAYLLTPNLQLDVTGGVSVGAVEAGSFAGGGIACRF